MRDDIVKKVLHYTLFYKAGHLKMDPDLRRRGGQEVGQAGEESVPLTWNDGRNRWKKKRRESDKR